MSARIIFSQRITKKHVFFLPSARIELLPISEKKQFISEDKKTIREKTSLFQVIKKHFLSYFFLLVFFVALIDFLSNRSIFYFILSNVFVISSPSLTFPKIGSMFF